MFILIEDQTEIRKAQSDLEATIGREFPTTAIRDIGWQGGRQPQAKVRSDGTYWFWSSDYKNGVANPRRLNWFGRTGDGQSVMIAVEVNTPLAGRNDSIAGFFARNTVNGRTYLFHSGRVGGGAKGVKKDALVAWADFELHPIYASDGSHKEGILVMPVAGPGAVRPAIAYVQTIIEFKAAVRNGDTQTSEALKKEQKLRKYFDEFFGRKRGKAAAREIDYISRHGEVVKALRDWRIQKGLATGQRVVKTALLDLGVSQGPNLIEAYEVKTSAVRGDIYTGIGQLIVHSRSHNCSRILVVPADVPLARDLAAALERNNIQLQLYKLTKTQVTLL
ncbi:hypothetical protein VA599_11190 [Chromobacterium sp. TRC.1.1.SA]|uniref:Restriction endonuclease type IV Mrr domain-containing protein n=1 Tax=Chromobacterium indicum TaxID=3110228 RepID=A0ABV0CJG7_9NEIS